MPTPRRLALSGAHQLSEPLAGVLAEGLERGDGPLVRAAAQGRMIAAPSLADDERLPDAWRAAAASGGHHALLAVPVQAPRHESGGMVAVFFAEERVFTEDDLELARHLADVTRGALERSELFEAERSARALAQQLTRTGRLLTSELDPAAVLEEVVQRAPELVNADASAIRLLEDDELVVNAAFGLGSEDAVGVRAPLRRRRPVAGAPCARRRGRGLPAT